MAGARYRRLDTWKRAMDLVDAVYDATGGWPKDEVFGLTSQTRRAAVSIPANIAEGQGRTGPREALHHLSIALGSLCEAETLLLIAHRRRYLNDSQIEPLLRLTEEVSRLLHGMIRGLQPAS